MTITRAKLVLGLGSNLGDRAAQLRAAGRALIAGGLIDGALWSSVHETVAMELPSRSGLGAGPGAAPQLSQGMFLNQVVSGRTHCSAAELLAALQGIERQAGRVRGERWAPRVLDLDILVYGDLCVSSAELTVPHPGIAERSFVLAPWAELEPDYLVPGLELGVVELLARLESGVDRTDTHGTDTHGTDTHGTDTHGTDTHGTGQCAPHALAAHGESESP